VLSQFSQYGVILRHVTPTNSGNWMHLKYQTRLQAQKAMAKSGRILGGSIMIGVTLLESDPFENNEAADKFHNHSTLADVSAVTTLNSSLGGARLNSSIRPLAQAYKAANADNKLADVSVASKSSSNGIVGKAMEYIFGW